MKRLAFALLAAAVLAGGTGCHSMHRQKMAQGGHGCSSCGHGSKHARLGKAKGHGCRGGAGTPDYYATPNDQIGPADGGPASAAITYPYYTTRGPRDFLVNDPPSIGR